LVLPQVIPDWYGRFFNTNIDTSTIYPGCTLYANTTLVSSFTQCQVVVVVLSFFLKKELLMGKGQVHGPLISRSKTNKEPSFDL
jgi:hypothetical protein